jgi:hypothetical protein
MAHALAVMRGLLQTHIPGVGDKGYFCVTVQGLGLWDLWGAHSVDQHPELHPLLTVIPRFPDRCSPNPPN